jgi:hypothetical protein
MSRNWREGVASEEGQAAVNNGISKCGEPNHLGVLRSRLVMVYLWAVGPIPAVP